MLSLPMPRELDCTSLSTGSAKEPPVAGRAGGVPAGPDALLREDPHPPLAGDLHLDLVRHRDGPRLPGVDLLGAAVPLDRARAAQGGELHAGAAGHPGGRAARAVHGAAGGARELGVGEALVSLLDDKGRPGVTQRALIVPPGSQLGPLEPAGAPTLDEALEAEQRSAGEDGSTAGSEGRHRRPHAG